MPAAGHNPVGVRTPSDPAAGTDDRYRWVALANTTAAVFMSVLDGSIVILGSLPPVSSLFAAVLGANPLQHLLAANGVLSALPAAARRTLTGKEFFPT
jgi:hypothetical protein